MSSFSQRFYHFIYYPAKVIFRFKHPVMRVYGKENLPAGAAVLCGNHSAFSDPVWIILAAKPKHIFRCMAKRELFETPILKCFFKKVGAFPVDRTANDINAIKTAMRVLRDDDKVLIFPEGTRIRNGKRSEPHGGAVLIAARTGVPIVPIYVRTDKRFWKPMSVVFGEPYYPKTAERRATNEEIRTLSEELMNRIYALGETM